MAGRIQHRARAVDAAADMRRTNTIATASRESHPASTTLVHPWAFRHHLISYGDRPVALVAPERTRGAWRSRPYDDGFATGTVTVKRVPRKRDDRGDSGRRDGGDDHDGPNGRDDGD